MEAHQQRAKFTVGMVLYHNTPTRGDRGVRYRIIRVEGGVAYHDKGIFTYGIDASGYAIISDYWRMEYPSLECKCGIFRGDCTYHKDQLL